MWQKPVVPAPTTEPISLIQAKRHCRIFHDDDDEYLADLIVVARAHVERYCGALFGQRDVDLTADDWADLDAFPVTPVTDVLISYIGLDGLPVSLDDEAFDLRNGGIVLTNANAWPARQSGSQISVVATTGYAEPDAPVRHAMLLLLSDMYERREPEPAAGRTTLDDLLANHREYA
jgi:uncharacterized phiE125 gp8 family phage protein